MHKTLHIVSGITVTNVMKQAKLAGDFLEWQDFLHIGPIPKNFSLQQRSKIRAYFLNTQGYYSNLDRAVKSYNKRNALLENYVNYEKIILWFEEDLYDQLQLLEILNWFALHLNTNIEISLVLTKKHLADYSFQELQEASRQKNIITNKHFQLAKKAWSALSDDTPLSWFKLSKETTEELPFLKNTIQRLLEEYPNTINGLSRTAHQALLTISKGEKKRRQEIFMESQKQEERPFIADIIFWKILNEFIEHKLIIEKKNNDLYITDLGKNILTGKENWITIKTIDHWIGGVHLSDDNLWCWNIREKTIGKYYYSTVLSTLIPIKEKPSTLLNK